MNAAQPKKEQGLSYKARKKWSLIVLLVWMPLYIFLALPLLAAIGEWNFWLRLVIYIIAAFIWLLPFKFVFLGVGKADPDAPEDHD